jgi:VCBS repeat-containing protein
MKALLDIGNARILVNAFPLRDTNTHTYSTDPNYISIQQIVGGTLNIKEYAVWIYNGTNQTINVQVIGNVTNDGTYPDYTIGSAYTVAPSSSNMYVLAMDTALSPFISVAISASTAPTSGNVYGVLIVQ